MSILGAVIVPHPPLIIPTVGCGREQEVQATIDAYRAAAEQVAVWAAECGLRSFQIMAGALDGLAVEAKLLSHEDVTGVGYGVATFAVTGPDEDRRFGKQCGELEMAEVSPETLADKALELRPHGNIGVAYTYNEPPTPEERVYRLADVAREHLSFVCTGNC